MAKKRANGEGNIRKRKDGRWEGRYTAGYDEKTGKRLIKNVLGKTQAEVKEKLAKAVAEAETVDVRRADEYTLGTWLQTWYELYAKPHLRFSTAEYYRRGIELHITPRIGDIPLKKADWARSAMALQGPTGTWAAPRSTEGEAAGSERLDDSRHPHDAAQRPRPGSERTPDCQKSSGRLRTAENSEARNENPAAGADQVLPDGC